LHRYQNTWKNSKKIYFFCYNNWFIIRLSGKIVRYFYNLVKCTYLKMKKAATAIVSVSTWKFCGYFIFCWPCISLQILANSQLDILFYVFIYFISLHVSSITGLIIRRSNCINTSSGMISLCKGLLGMPAYNAVLYTD